MGSKTVSVVIPTHNSAAFLPRAIRSVLAQTRGCYEIIVVDDGSTDGTSAVQRQFQGLLKYILQPNRGVSAARNTGIRAASGEYVCFLDADDEWKPEKLEHQIQFLSQHPDVTLVFCDEEERDGERVHKPSILRSMKSWPDMVSQIPMKNPFEKLLGENFIPTSTVMVRRNSILEAGLFDENLRVAEDRDLWLRIAAHGSVACLPEILGIKEIHEGNLSRRTELTLRSRIEVWDKARNLFPDRFPAPVYHGLMAGTTQELGALLLARGEGPEARGSAVKSLASAVRYVLATRSLFPYRWMLSVCLIPLSYLRWSVVRTAWRYRNELLGRTSK